jgi:hypothetical protein
MTEVRPPNALCAVVIRPILERLEHDPEKCVAVLGKDHVKIKELDHGDDSRRNHRALADTGSYDRRCPSISAASE